MPRYSDGEDLLSFGRYLTSDGSVVVDLVPAGVADMRVDGSSTPVDFFLDGSALVEDLFITGLTMSLGGQNAGLADFAQISALTNGLLVTYERDETITGAGAGQRVSDLKVIRSNFDATRWAGGAEFAALTNVGRYMDAINGSEMYVARMDCADKYGLAHGFQIRAGSNDVLKITVRDDLTTATEFDVFVSGFQPVR